MHFPVAGIDISPLWPPLVAFAVSILTSMGGVSGAFVLLPFQVSVLGFTGLSVTPTNHVYNIVAIPGGLSRFIREQRMAWPLTWTIVIGTMPGVVAGTFLRAKYLPNPANFKMFVGCVLGYIGARLLYDSTIGAGKKNPRLAALEKSFQEKFSKKNETAGVEKDVAVRTLRVSASLIEYEFYGEIFSFKPAAVLLLALIVGMVGGAYGIGGGAIIAPFVVSFFELPVYTIAGAALMGTFITSIVGVASFYVFTFTDTVSGLRAFPDWKLGILFGLGGLAGTYAGARLQKYMPAKFIKIILAAAICFLAARYVVEFVIKYK